MKKFLLTGILLAAFCAAGLTIYAAMNGDRFRPSDTTATRNLNLGDFHEIDASVALVEYTPGAEGLAVLEAPDNVINDVKVSVRDGKLTVNLADNFRRNVRSTESLRIKVKVASKAIDEISLSTGAKLTVNGDLSIAGDFELECSTGAVAVLKKVECSDADIKAETGSSLEIKELTANKADVEAQTGSNIKVGELLANVVDCEASTGAVVTVEKATSPYAELEAATAGVVTVGGDIVDGKATASTAGTIKCPSNLRRTASTGGTIN